ncbi:hypothetical protein CPB85DRAFT_1153723, partial [Mucidula mucida]
LCVTGLSVCHVGERFQHSNDTIAKYFRRTCETLSGTDFYTLFVSLPSTDNPPHPYLLNNPKFWPFFRGCIGAMDGSHIASCPSAADHANARNRK